VVAVGVCRRRQAGGEHAERDQIACRWHQGALEVRETGPWHRGQRRAHDRRDCSDTVDGSWRQRPNASDLQRRCGRRSSVRLRCTNDAVAQPSEDAMNKSPPTQLKPSGCNFLFPSSSLVLWTCFLQLQDLEIEKCCYPLIYWPEN
ncbi:unnamed protein product, partial [Urochloa humidicola]